MIRLRNRAHVQLTMHLLRIYTVVSIFGIVIITLHNLYINDLPLARFFYPYFWIKLLFGCMLVLLFHFISRWRLRDVHRYWNSGEDPDLRRDAWRSLLRFPAEMFWGMIVYGLIVSPSYHITMVLLDKDTPTKWTLPQGMYVLENLLFDQALTLMLATLFYAVLRQVSRMYLRKIEYYDISGVQPSSFVRPLVVTFISLMLITIFSMLWFVSNSVSSGRSIPLATVFAIALFVMLLGTILFSLQAIEQRSSFREVIGGIRSLLGQERKLLIGKVPITSSDEAGQLVAAFNELQAQIAEEYEEVEKELQLARNVQQKLLPKPCQEIGALRIAGTYIPTREVGGDFYDIIDLRDGRSAVVIGDVSGSGLQAALIMSAVVVLLRTEIRKEGSADEMLSRLNRSLAETIHGHSFVTIGLGIFDSRQASFEYASAGHLSPYLLRNKELLTLDCSSLPLGIDPDIVYTSNTLPLEAGDRLVFYTDGVIEIMNDQGDMWGFESFELLLSRLDHGLSPLQAVDSLMAQLPRNHASRYEDDRTIVLVQVVRDL